MNIVEDDESAERAQLQSGVDQTGETGQVLRIEPQGSPLRNLCQAAVPWLSPSPGGFRLAVMKPASPRLFTPGDGAAPPVMPGREEHQAVLSQCLTDLAVGQSPPHNVVLIGPRGNGKTTLLNWFKRECRRSKVDAVSLTPRDMADVHMLLAELAPPSRLIRLLSRKVGVTGVGSAEWETQARVPASLAGRLIRRCRKRPLTVLLDEAHTLDATVGGTLLNASQQVRSEAPFLLVLAGTPGLPAQLAKMDATFWNRLGSGRLGVGRLNEAATRQALQEPLRRHDVHIAEDGLGKVVEECQRYPYFVQLWGEALWQQRLTTGATTLTDGHVDAVRGQVAARVAEYYQDHLRELEAGGLLEAAAAVAPLFQRHADATATDHEIDAVLAPAGVDAAARLAAREELNRLGYIWRPPGQPPPITWCASIPSLMTHVRHHVSGNVGAS